MRDCEHHAPPPPLEHTPIHQWWMIPVRTRRCDRIGNGLQRVAERLVHSSSNGSTRQSSAVKQSCQCQSVSECVRVEGSQRCVGVIKWELTAVSKRVITSMTTDMHAAMSRHASIVCGPPLGLASFVIVICNQHSTHRTVSLFRDGSAVFIIFSASCCSLRGGREEMRHVCQLFDGVLD